MEESAIKASNFFAVRSANEFSFDGETWYKEGEKVHIAIGAFSRKDAVIRSINEDCTILFDSEGDDLKCRISDIKIGKSLEDGSIIYQSGEMTAYRASKQFSIDLVEWFDTKQKCIVNIGTQILIGAVVENVSDTGEIVFDYNGTTEIVSYEDIKDIWDYYSNTICLMDGETDLDVIFYISSSIKKIQH